MNNNQPLVSIAMTTYNGEKYLSQQIESILNQSFNDFELIICDDNSNDKTLTIIEDFQKKYTFIKLYKNKKRLGVVKNFEQAIKLAKCKYIALADQDDIWHNQKLEKLLNAASSYEKKTPLMVHSDLTMVDSSLNELHKSFFRFRGINLKNKKELNKIISHNGVMGCTILFNQALKEKMLPFPKDLDVHDYWIALVNEVFGTRLTIYDTLVKYRIHNTNTSNNQQKILKKRNFLSSIINNDKLPFINLKRDIILKEFLSRYDIDEDETKIIDTFIQYLDGNTNPFVLIFNLIKYNIIRENIRYRLKIFIKILQRRF
jgi:glycosyltransferase involved in cell wall biosynthesis